MGGAPMPPGAPMRPPGGPMGPMGQNGPMGGQRPVRQGTSHVVPVVVAAGLAVGVFCGLLFGLGTKREAAQPSKGTNGAKLSAESQVQAADVSIGTKPPDKPAAAAPPVAAPAAPAAPPKPPPPGKIAIEIKPDNLAQSAKIFVDGKQVTGPKAEIAFEPGATKRSVKVLIQVPGYPDIARDLDVESDAESAIAFDLKAVKPTGTGTPANPPAGTPSSPANAGDAGARPKPPRNDGPQPPPKKPPGKGSGLIDI
jgi:hypothetical protein